VGSEQILKNFCTGVLEIPGFLSVKEWEPWHKVTNCIMLRNFAVLDDHTSAGSVNFWVTYR